MNDRLSEFQNYPEDVVHPGASMRDIARFQAERGDFGGDDPDDAFEDQMQLLLTRRARATSASRSRVAISRSISVRSTTAAS